MDNQQAIHWFAGFFEGEGCFSFNRNDSRGSRLQPWMSISNTDARAISECEKVLTNWCVQYTKRLQEDKRGHKPCYHLRIHSVEQVLSLCEKLQPLLECDRERCASMLRFCRSRQGRVGHAPTNDLEWQCYSEITQWQASTTEREDSYSINADWLAGIYEAEGSFSLNQNGTPIVQLVNVNTRIIFKAKAHLDSGYHVRRYASSSGWQPIWHLNLCGHSKFRRLYALIGDRVRFRKSELDVILERTKIQSELHGDMQNRAEMTRSDI